MKDLSETRKSWSSLSTLKRVIETTKNHREKIIEFDGYKLVTSKFEYQLYDGQIYKSPPPPKN